MTSTIQSKPSPVTYREKSRAEGEAWRLLYFVSIVFASVENVYIHYLNHTLLGLLKLKIIKWYPNVH